MMARKQRTIKVEDDLWIKLQNLAAIQNKTCTELINEDIRARVDNTIAPSLKAKVDKAVEASLNKAIDESLINQIVDRVSIKLSKQNDTIKTVETVGTVKTKKPTKKDKTVETVGTVKTKKPTEEDKTVGTVGAVKTKKPTEEDKTVGTVGAVKTKKPTEQDKIARNLAKFRRYKASANHEGKSDAEVAAITSIRSNYIKNYRKGIVSPKQKFRDSWGLSDDGERWIQNLEGQN